MSRTDSSVIRVISLDDYALLRKGIAALVNAADTRNHRTLSLVKHCQPSEFPRNSDNLTKASNVEDYRRLEAPRPFKSGSRDTCVHSVLCTCGQCHDARNRKWDCHIHSRELELRKRNLSGFVPSRQYRLSDGNPGIRVHVCEMGDVRASMRTEPVSKKMTDLSDR